MNVIGIDVGKNNLALCHVSENIIKHWEVVSGGATAPEVYATLTDISFSSWCDPSNTTVVIERQPSKNPTMTRIQHYLEMYCAFLGVPCVLQDSKAKLFYAATTPWWPKDLATSEWTYTRRKRLAVETARSYLKDTSQTMEATFVQSKKKDDLADSLLHALAYMHATSKLAQTRTPVQNKRVVAREPSAKQRSSGKLSPSNVKWVLRTAKTPEDVARIVKADPLGKATTRAIKKHFGSVEGYFEQINGLKKLGPEEGKNDCIEQQPSVDGDVAVGMDADQPHASEWKDGVVASVHLDEHLT